MVQSIKHGIGEYDHIYTTYKNLPDTMPDSICKEKFGFENIEFLQEYQSLSEETKDLALKKALEEINAYFITVNKDYTFENKGNLVAIEFLNIPQSEREGFGLIISEIMEQIKTKILNFRFNRNYKSTGIMKLRFHIKNCGWNFSDQNVITFHDKMSSQIEGEIKKMSSQNHNEKENVITNPDEDQKNVMTKLEEEGNVITKPKKGDYIHLRISTEKKAEIQEKAHNAKYKSLSKYIIDVMTKQESVMTNEESVITSNMNHRILHDKIDSLTFYKEKSKDFALMFNHLFENNPEVKKAVLVYKKKFPDNFENIKDLIKKLKGG